MVTTDGDRRDVPTHYSQPCHVLPNPATAEIVSAIFRMMARLVRITAVNVSRHVTQRGNARQFLLASESERAVYLDLLHRYAKLYGLSILGYCLMSNHVHLIVVPHAADSLALALKYAHGRYACFWNAAHDSSGHAWQNRFYSCPLDPSHLWIALRYTELNPVRAGLVREAEAWPWSSAPVHCGHAEPASGLDLEMFYKRWSAESWRNYLAVSESTEQLVALRQCTHNGRPLGSVEFVRSIGQSAERDLVAKRGGRPVDSACTSQQEVLSFDQ
jgi:putative transposase